MIEELKPEEYADFVSCMKENLNQHNYHNPKIYKMMKSILCDPENKAYFTALSSGSQIAMMIYVEMYERHELRLDQINSAIRSITE